MDRLHSFERRFDNGFELLCVPIPTASVVGVALVYRVGSRNESSAQSGIAHLLEHLLFRGSLNYNNQRGNHMGKVIAGMGGHSNAYTSIDATVYHATVPGVYLEDVLTMEADRMHGALLTPRDIVLEKSIVSNESERRLHRPAQRLHMALRALAFTKHPYMHAVIGDQKAVAEYSLEQIREFYDTYYQPDNAQLIITGAVSPQDAETMVERLFGSMPCGSRVRHPVALNEPPQTEARRLVVAHGAEHTLLYRAYHRPALLGQNAVLDDQGLRAHAQVTQRTCHDGYALIILSSLLAGSKTSLFREALIHNELALDASKAMWSSRDPGLFELRVTVHPQSNVAQVEEKIDKIIADLILHGPKRKLFDRVQTALIRFWREAGETPTGLARLLADSAAAGNWHAPWFYADTFALVTREHVQAVASSYLTPQQTITAILLPGAQREPMAAHALADNHVEREGAPNSTILIPRKILQRLPSTFARGMSGHGVSWRYMHKPASHRVSVHASTSDFLVLENNSMLAGMHAAMLTRGTALRNKHKVNVLLDEYCISRSYTPCNRPDRFTFKARCFREDLHTLFELLTEELQTPAFLEDELNRLKRNKRGMLELQRSDAQQRASQHFRAMIYGDADINSSPHIERRIEDLAHITLDDVYAYHIRFLSSVHLYLAGTGGCTEQDFASAVDRYFTGLPTIAPFPSAVATVVAQAREVRAHIDIPDTSEIVVKIGRPSAFTAVHEARPAMVVANAGLGWTGTCCRLRRRLREELGLTYHVSSAFMSATRIPGPWCIAFGSNANHVERAISEVRLLLADFSATGPEGWEIAYTRGAIVGGDVLQMENEAAVASRLATAMYLVKPDSMITNHAAEYEAVTDAEVREAAAIHLNDRDLTIVTAGTWK